MARRCIFCGGRPLTREHAWPLWSSTAIGGEGDFTIIQNLQERELREWTRGELEIIVRRVCHTCNNGWMSELEEEAQPILTPMIQGKNLPVTMNRKQQDTVALWATKTAMMLEFVHGGPRHIPPDHHRWVYDHREPPPKSLTRLGGYAMQIPHGASKFAPIRSQADPLTIASPSDPARRINAYAMTMRIGYLVVQVFGYEFRGDDLEISFGVQTRDVYLVVWPRGADYATWPAGVRPWKFIDDQGFDRLATVFRTTQPPQGD